MGKPRVVRGRVARKMKGMGGRKRKRVNHLFGGGGGRGAGGGTGFNSESKIGS